METLMWIGLASFWAFAVLGAVRLIIVNGRFEHHLRQYHQGQWRQIYQDHIIRKSLLWPFMKGTPVDFVWTSHEDFGDSHISEIRRQIHFTALGIASAALAGMFWFGVIAYWLSRTR